MDQNMNYQGTQVQFTEYLDINKHNFRKVSNNFYRLDFKLQINQDHVNQTIDKFDVKLKYAITVTPTEFRGIGMKISNEKVQIMEKFDLIFDDTERDPRKLKHKSNSIRSSHTMKSTNLCLIFIHINGALSIKENDFPDNLWVQWRDARTQ